MVVGDKPMGWTDVYEALDRWYKEDAYKMQLAGVRPRDWDDGELILHDRKEISASFGSNKFKRWFQKWMKENRAC